MESAIAQALNVKHQPVAVVFSDERPDGALQFDKGKWGCVMFMLAAAAKGRTAAFDRETFGCHGGGVGLGFGNRYEDFPGGLEGFYRFLSDGNEKTDIGKKIAEGMKAGGARDEFVHHFLHGERYRKNPDLVRQYVESLPIADVPTRYVLLKPLDALAERGEDPLSVTFFVDADQFAALTVFANYDRAQEDAVLMPHVASCQSMGILTYREQKSDNPRCIAGLNDLSARMYLRGQFGKDFLTFSIPWKRFLEMEGNVEGSFLQVDPWVALRG